MLLLLLLLLLRRLLLRRRLLPLIVVLVFRIVVEMCIVTIADISFVLVSIVASLGLTPAEP